MAVELIKVKDGNSEIQDKHVPIQNGMYNIFTENIVWDSFVFSGY